MKKSIWMVCHIICLVSMVLAFYGGSHAIKYSLMNPDGNGKVYLIIAMVLALIGLLCVWSIPNYLSKKAERKEEQKMEECIANSTKTPFWKQVSEKE